MKRFVFWFLVVGFCALSAQAQTPIYPVKYTVATLPAAATMRDRVVTVTDQMTPGDCIKGGGSYRGPCISDGTRWVPWADGGSSIDVRRFGAKCDDATNDAAAIQAAIDSLGTTAATRNGPEIVIPGPCAIGSTITIDRKSLVFRGLGWGRKGESGVQSYLRWIGSAGVPMLKITNISGLALRDLHLIGNASAKPSSAISLYQGSLVATSANSLTNILIGDAVDGTAIGKQFVDGLRFEGLPQNNSEWQMSNIRIANCTGSALYQASIQYSNTLINGLAVFDCAIGVNNVGQVIGANWNFANNGTDIYFRSTDDFSADTYPQIYVTHFGSEGSERLLEMPKEGVVSLRGGTWMDNGLHADHRIVKSEGNGNRTLRLEDFSLGSTTGYIEFKSTTFGQGLRNLIFDGMRSFPAGGPSGTGLDVATLNRQDHAYIYYRASADTTTPEYIPPHKTETFLFGVGGEDFRFDTFDIPARLRLIPDQFGQNITSASNTITADAAQKLITNSTGGAITLTSTPTITAGKNGDVMILTNVGADPIILQDSGTLSGSKLVLKNFGSRLVLKQNESAQFVYLKTGTGNPDAWLLQQTNGDGDLAYVSNYQGGTSYTIVASDNRKFLVLDNSSAIAVTLPQAAGSFTTGWTIDIGAIGIGTATITPTTSTINATAVGGSSTATSLAIPSGKSVRLVSNGTNYVAYNYQGRF